MTDQRWTVRRGLVSALFWPDDENPDMPFSVTEADLAEMLPDALDRQVSAMFAALADALERDRKVAEIVAAIDNEPPSGTAGVTSNARLFLAIAALYPETGKPPRSSMDDDWKET